MMFNEYRGKQYRSLDLDEVIRDGDMLSSIMTTGWATCTAGDGKSLMTPRQRMDWIRGYDQNLVFWRECDPLIAEMLKAKEKAE